MRQSAQYFKYLFKNRTYTITDKNFNNIVIKIPLRIRIIQYINDILSRAYNWIWKLFPFYSSKWYYKFLPYITLADKWFSKAESKYDI
jgi:hypothetical protein